MKTIKQIADELGISKDRVKYQVRKLPGEFTEKKENITYIKDCGINELLALLGNKSGNYPDKISPSTHLFTYNENAFLHEQIKNKDRQIEVQADQIATRDRQISELTTALENTTSSLRAAQALHAGSMKQLVNTSASLIQPEQVKATRKSLFQRIFKSF